MMMIKTATMAAAMAVLASAQAFAQGDSAGGVSRTETGAAAGEQLYGVTCAACHMKDGKGGAGAAAIPALAGDARLAAAAYPIQIVLTGRGAMPSFAPYMKPAQMAAVITYVRTSFGNSYAAPVTEADVTAAMGRLKK